MIGSFLRKAQVTGGCAATSAPSKVTGLTATPSGTTTINLSWTANADAAPNTATGYTIESSPDGSTWSELVKDTTATSYADTTLSASQTRHYRVYAFNCLANGSVSDPVSATTAAGSIAPTWSIDWSSGTPSGYTFTRASTGTYVDSSGYIASASTDVARLTHNSSGSRLGLLVEEARTNVCLQSNNLTSGTWAKGSGVTVTANYATGPDGTTSATRLEMPNNVGIRQTVGTGTTVSFWIKSNTGSSQTIYQWIGSALAITAGTTWERVSFTLPAGTTQIDIYNGSGAGTTRDVLVWGFQAEASTTPSSYIPTTTATVTRSADLAHVLDSSITSWGAPGALVVHFYSPGQAGTLLSTDDASTAQVGIEASTTTAARAFWSSNSTATGTIGSGVQKAVHYWNGSTSKFCINGGTVQSGTNNLTIANTDFVTFGAEATDSGGAPSVFSQYANMVIRKVEFYSGTLTDANLQTITT